jgi:hypothetical protein
MMKRLLGLGFFLLALLPGAATAQTNTLVWCAQGGTPLASSPCTGIPVHIIAANSDNATLVAAGPHILLGAQLSGVGSAPAYVKFYDKATAPTCGTDTPKKELAIPAASTAANGGGSNVTVSLGTSFVLGLGFCVVTGIADSDDTAVAAATFNINFDYK